MTFALSIDGAALLVLVATIVALRYLGWFDKFHHAWIGFAAFMLTPAALDHYRLIPLVIMCDDALQHIWQAIQWARIGNGKPAPPETPGWPHIFRSPLHLLYSVVYGWFA